LLDGTQQQPGQVAQSMMGQQIAAPGEAARSLLDGSVQQGRPGESMLHAPGGPGQPGLSMMHPEAAGGVPGDSMMHDPGAAAAAAEAMAAGGQAPNVTMTPITGKGAAEAQLVTDPTKAQSDADLAATDDKAADDKAPLWSGAKEDEELVDPNADRPDFGTTAEEEDAAADEAAHDDADEGTLAAAAGKAVPFKQRKELDPAYVTAAVMLVATIACGAVLWSQRVALMKLWPGFAAVYEKTGLAPKNPGEGLRLAQSGMRLQRIGGVETLVVKGYISNVGTGARKVPDLRLQLVDATNQVVQEVKSAAPKSNLDPGGSVDFELRLELPEMNKAKNVIVAWDAG
jgi:hypothetical protein